MLVDVRESLAAMLQRITPGLLATPDLRDSYTQAAKWLTDVYAMTPTLPTPVDDLFDTPRDTPPDMPSDTPLDHVPRFPLTGAQLRALLDVIRALCGDRSNLHSATSLSPAAADVLPPPPPAPPLLRPASTSGGPSTSGTFPRLLHRM